MTEDTNGRDRIQDDSAEQAQPESTDDDTIVIDLDDLDEPVPEPVSSESGTTMVIELGDEEPQAPVQSEPMGLDLTGMDFSEDPPHAPAYPVGKPVYETEPSSLKGKGSLGKTQQTAGDVFSYRGVLTMALGGLLGGLVGWILTEPLQSLMKTGVLGLGKVSSVALYAALVGGSIGAALGLANGLNIGVSRKMPNWAISGLLFGLIGGAVGGSIAQSIFGSVATGHVLGGYGQIVLRAVGWSMMGVFFGLGQAAVLCADKKLRNGVIGGAIGGFVGGIAFQLIRNSGMENLQLARFLALCCMGLSIGALIGLVEEVAKEAWVRIIEGPLSGKQFILYEDSTSIGSDPICSIMLIKDPLVAPQHAVIANNLTEYSLSAVRPDAPVLVNGRQISNRVLDDYDVISVGKTQFEFRERQKSESDKDTSPSGKSN